ncbi:serine/threonine-protein kinase [Actinoplanes sp. NPDC049668]|uniref:serine/threonine-protein kinase n=1 Tax=unclassified Actinoplanes TaxID=2626549 RepID=UPI0033BE6829
MTPSPLRADDPRQLGAYRLTSRLGAGGMGSVYLGESAEGRQVAVKVIRPELSSDPGFRARFRSEVKRARQVPPFCTAEVLDADANHATPYLVVEYVDGPNLAEIVQERGPLSGGGLHSLAIGVATALAAIHDAGVIHRDLKPANVLFSLGTPKVIDFGIAKALDTTSRHTVPGQVLGTIAYMGPERFDARRAETAAPSTDVFAWGAVVTYAATGHTPFAPEALIATAAGIALPTPDLSALPMPLRDLVAAALREDPDDRPTAHELLERLLKAGAAGNSVIRAGLENRPELKRAAAAVRRTVRLDDIAARIGRPGATKTTLVRAGSVRTRWMPPGAVAAVTALALVAGLVADPLARRVTDTGAPAPSPSGSGPAGGRDAATDERTSRGGSRGGCTLDGPLEVTPQAPRPFSCPASHTPREQTIRARVRLGAPGACAAIWTHQADENGYRITICADRITLDLEERGRARTLAFGVLDPPVEPTDWHEIEVLTPGPGIMVNLDHEQVVSKPRTRPPLARGTVALGLVPGTPPSGRPGRTRIEFANVSITSAP